MKIKNNLLLSIAELMEGLVDIIIIFVYLVKKRLGVHEKKL
jgi:hypothetical protein